MDKQIPKKEVKVTCMAGESSYRLLKDNFRKISSSTEDMPDLKDVNFADLNCMDSKAMASMSKSKREKKMKKKYELRISLKFLSPISQCMNATTAPPP